MNICKMFASAGFRWCLLNFVGFLRPAKILATCAQIRKYTMHIHRRLSMDNPLSTMWVCPKCLYENEDYHWCMGPGCDNVKPGGIFNTSLQSSNGLRTTINIAWAWEEGWEEAIPSCLRVSLMNCKDKCRCKYVWPLSSGSTSRLINWVCH
jgi:hypothetical protein